MQIYLFLFSDFVSLEEYNTRQKTWKDMLMGVTLKITETAIYFQSNVTFRINLLALTQIQFWEYFIFSNLC